MNCTIKPPKARDEPMTFEHFQKNDQSTISILSIKKKKADAKERQ